MAEEIKEDIVLEEEEFTEVEVSKETKKRGLGDKYADWRLKRAEKALAKAKKADADREANNEKAKKALKIGAAILAAAGAAGAAAFGISKSKAKKAAELPSDLDSMELEMSELTDSSDSTNEDSEVVVQNF